MATARELLRQGRRDEVWQKYCGFFDLKLSEFMQVQRSLLLEQIHLLSQCELGVKILGGEIPRSVEAFRQDVQLTTYEDYEPDLSEKREDVLPSKPVTWARTSGRSGNGNYKWAPVPESIYVQFGEAVVGSLLVASCSQKGEVYLDPGDVLFMMNAPPPYVSGIGTRSANEQMDVRFVPPLDEGEQMDFSERIAEGFETSMKVGLDYFYGLSSVLAKIGERFEDGSSSGGASFNYLHPITIARLFKGLLIARINKRGMLPSDIWKVKGIVTGGADTDIYREKINHYWGKMPLEAYGCTEGGALAMQAWNYKGMTFVHNVNFLEFIPHEEHIANKRNPKLQPSTLLLDELEPGIYELVLTNLRGGIFTRYRIGDLIEVISRRDDEIGIDLPQIRFYARADDVIDLAGFTRITEKIIWKVIEATGIKYEDWVVRKEEVGKEPILHIYIETIPTNGTSPEILTASLRDELRKQNQEYADLEDMLGGNRLRVTQLPVGSFARYIDIQQEAGADLAHIKPPHMQPSKEIMEKLLQT